MIRPEAEYLDGQSTVGEARNALRDRLRSAGVPEPEREALLLIEAATGLRRIDLITSPERRLGAAAPQAAEIAARRARGEPLSRILGRREFWSLQFRITPDVLDPRADTETLIEASLSQFSRRRNDPLRIVDFGVGSGAILAALLAEFPAATGLGVDRSERAIATATENLAKLGFLSRARLALGDWGSGLQGPFDLVVSNPPYIPTGEIAGLDREVREHDPHLALDGGPDGLDAYRALAPHVLRLLEPGSGRFVLEHGAGQSEALRDLLARAGLETVAIARDLGGLERIVVGRAA